MQIPSISPSSIPSIPSISETGSIQKATSSSGSVQNVTQSFENVLNSLNASQANSDNLVQQLSQGNNVDLHTVMIGMQENDVNFNVALAVRDKLVEAYRQVMSMQV